MVLIVLLCFLPFIFTTCSGEEELILSHVLYRHGDRSPVRSYPLDPYNNESYWPEGYGQLTKIGKEMEYKLGFWLRERYTGFIGETYSPNEVHILSTDIDRTLMSAQCVMAAFYFPDGKARFNQSVPWMPAAIHTSPSGSDVILNVDDSCPRISKEIAKMRKLPEIREYLQNHAELIKYLNLHTGLNISTILELDFLYDTLYVESLYNLTLPEWTNGVMGKLKEAADLSFIISAYTTEMKRLRGGPLLKQIASHMVSKSHKNLTEKLFMYSAHDSTVAILMNSMNVFNNVTPPYAATVLIELYKSGQEHYVKTFYRNDSNIVEDAHLLTVPGCTEACPLAKWIELMSYAIPENWNRECHRPDPELDAYYIQALAGLFCFLAALVVLHSFLCILHYFRSCRRGSGPPSRAGSKGYTLIRNAVLVPDYGSIKRGKEVLFCPEVV